MTGDVISLDDFRKSATDIETEENPMEELSPESHSDALANELMMELQEGLIDAGICPRVDVNDEILTAIYDLTRAITDRHFDVFNELITTRNIQAEHGEPFFLTDVFIKTPHEEEDDA